jgi:galactose mutarotase-like enzyme
VDGTLIPTGELRPVAGTLLDFRAPTPIGTRINADDAQLKFAGGYDHNWIVNGAPGALRLAARVAEPTSGRVMEVYTTETRHPVLAGNFLPPTLRAKAARSTTGAAASAWRRSTTRIRPTSQSFRPPHFVLARRTGRRRSTGLGRNNAGRR